MVGDIHVNLDVDKVLGRILKACGQCRSIGLQNIVNRYTADGIFERASLVKEAAFEELVIFMQTLSPQQYDLIHEAVKRMQESELECMKMKADGYPAKKVTKEYANRATTFHRLVQMTSETISVKIVRDKANSEPWMYRETLSDKDKEATAWITDALRTCKEARKTARDTSGNASSKQRSRSVHGATSEAEAASCSS